MQPGANFSLDELQSALNAAVAKAFGLSTSGNYVNVALSGSVLKLTLNFAPSLSPSTPSLNFNLASLGLPTNSNIPGVTDFTGSDITLQPSASFNLVLDIDLTSPSNPVFDLDSATQFVLGLLMVGPSNGTLALGPLGITWAGGTLTLSKADGDTTDPATFTIGLKNTTSLSTLTSAFAGNGWLNSSSAVKATITGQVNVNLPLSANIGGSTSSLGTLTLTIANLGNFITDLFTNTGNLSNDISFSPPSLSNAFSNLDLLGNIDDITGSLDNYLNALQSVLNGQLFGLNIPVIGSALASAGSFVTQIKQAVDSITSASEFQGIYDALTGALGAFDPPAPVVQIQYLETGHTTFENFTSGEPLSSLPSPQNIEAVQIDFNLGGTWTPGTMPTLNLGLPGLGLTVSNGAVQVGVGWNLAFDLGIDRSDGPYIVIPTSGTNVTADIFANLSTTAAITAQLGFLALTASQPTPGQPDPNNNSVTAFDTGASVNFNAGFKNGSATLGGESITPVSSFSLSNMNISLAGSVGVDLDLSLGFDISGGAVDTQYPHFTAELLMGTSLSATPAPWTFGVNLSGVNSTSPDVAFNNLSLNLGDFLNNYLGKIIDPLAQVVKPIEPFLNFLSTTIPIINEPLLTAISQIFGGDVEGLAEITKFVDAIVNFVGELSNGSSLTVNLGSFNLNQFNLLMPAGSGGNSVPNLNDPTQLNQLLSDVQSSMSQPSMDGLTQAEDESSGFSSFMGEVGSGSITFPILSNPITLIGLMFGKQANLVVATSPELTANVSELDRHPRLPVRYCERRNRRQHRCQSFRRLRHHWHRGSGTGFSGRRFRRTDRGRSGRWFLHQRCANAKPAGHAASHVLRHWWQPRRWRQRRPRRPVQRRRRRRSWTEPQRFPEGLRAQQFRKPAIPAGELRRQQNTAERTSRLDFRLRRSALRVQPERQYHRGFVSRRAGTVHHLDPDYLQCHPVLVHGWSELQHRDGKSGHAPGRCAHALHRPALVRTRYRQRWTCVRRQRQFHGFPEIAW